MTHKPKSNVLAAEVGKAYWDTLGEKTRSGLITLLQNGQRPQNIEDHMRVIVDRDFPSLPDWKRKEIAARYYLASDYALQNNLHLN